MDELKVFYSDVTRISLTKGKNAKLVELEKIAEVTKTIMSLTWDPFHLYGITKLPPVNGYGSGVDDEQIIIALCNGDTRWFKDNACNLTAFQYQIVNGILGNFQPFKLGVTGASFLKVFPNTFHVYDVQLAAPYDKKHLNPESVTQAKIDGIRCNVIVDNKKHVECLSRNGKPILNLDPDIMDKLSTIDNFVFDGEVVTDNDFQLSAGLVHKQLSDVKLGICLFDGLTYEEFFNQKCDLPWIERDRRLRYNVETAGLNVSEFVLESFDVSTHDDVMKYHEIFLDDEKEGSVVKSKSGLYEFKRTRSWMKVKTRNTDEFQILDYAEGTGKNAGSLGAFFVHVPGGKVTRVGGGYSDKHRKLFWEERDELVEMGAKLEVEFFGYTKEGALRHPEFLKIRKDK